MQPKRRVRADALRNEDAVLEAAKEVFHNLGRRRSGQKDRGQGRRWRWDALSPLPEAIRPAAAVFRREVDACAAKAKSLAAENPPGEALARWLKRYTEFITTKRGLAAALHSGDPAFDALPAYFRASFEPALRSLLDAAVAAGQVRGD